jgi:hypothetical protein
VGRAELAHRENFKGSVESCGDLSGDWDATTRQPDYDRLSLCKRQQASGELTASIPTIRKAPRQGILIGKDHLQQTNSPTGPNSSHQGFADTMFGFSPMAAPTNGHRFAPAVAIGRERQGRRCD